MSGADLKAAAERPQDRAARKGGEEVRLAAVLRGNASLASAQPVAELPDGLRGADDAQADLLGPLGGEVDGAVVHESEAHVDVPAVGGELEQRFGKVGEVKGAQAVPSPFASSPRRLRSPATDRRERRTAARGPALR